MEKNSGIDPSECGVTAAIHVCKIITLTSNARVPLLHNQASRSLLRVNILCYNHIHTAQAGLAKCSLIKKT